MRDREKETDRQREREREADRQTERSKLSLKIESEMLVRFSIEKKREEQIVALCSFFAEKKRERECLYCFCKLHAPSYI